MAKTNELPSLELLNEYFEVDFENGILYWKKRHVRHFNTQQACNIWNSQRSGKIAGSLGKYSNRWSVTIDNITYLQNRILYYMYYEEIDNNLVIDHIDRNPSNNSISNLRQATYSANSENKAGYSNLKIKGIRLTKYNTYSVQLYSNGTYLPKKSFKLIEDALSYRNKLVIDFKLGIDNYQ